MVRALPLVVLLAAAACGSPAQQPAQQQEEPGQQEDQDGQEEPAEETPATIEPSDVSAPFVVLDRRGNRVAPRQAPEGMADPTAHWYQAGGLYVVVYAGIPEDELGPLCPGNSIFTGDQFEHVTNAPTGQGGCADLEDDPQVGEFLPTDGFGARVCDGLIVYGTDIPVNADGVLFASMPLTLADDGEGSLLSQVEADRQTTPEIDPDAPAYAVPSDFLPDGAETVAC